MLEADWASLVTVALVALVVVVVAVVVLELAPGNTRAVGEGVCETLGVTVVVGRLAVVPLALALVAFSL